MKTPSEIVNHFGRQRVALAVGVSPKAVTNTVCNGKLPASWYMALCALAGRKLPAECFTFKGVAAPVKTVADHG